MYRLKCYFHHICKRSHIRNNDANLLTTGYWPPKLQNTHQNYALSTFIIEDSSLYRSIQPSHPSGPSLIQCLSSNAKRNTKTPRTFLLSIFTWRSRKAQTTRNHSFKKWGYPPRNFTTSSSINKYEGKIFKTVFLFKSLQYFIISPFIWTTRPNMFEVRPPHF